jgi:hypothetical protein
MVCFMIESLYCNLQNVYLRGLYYVIDDEVFYIVKKK